MTHTWQAAIQTAATTMLRYPDKISDGLEAELYALLETLGTPHASQPASTGTADDAGKPSPPARPCRQAEEVSR
jgi:hypothetical protein